MKSNLGSMLIFFIIIYLPLMFVYSLVFTMEGASQKPLFEDPEGYYSQMVFNVSIIIWAILTIAYENIDEGPGVGAEVYNRPFWSLSIY